MSGLRQDTDMGRRKNIFDFATKELTATAVWAWILDSERWDDDALRALTADLRLKLGVPVDAVCEDVQTEQNPDDPGLKLLAPAEPAGLNEGSGRRRIDILATYRMRDGGRLRLVIENKVRSDPNVIAQVTDYRERLQRRVTGPVRAAVFTFDNALASSMLAKDSSVTVLTLSEMVALIEKHGSSSAVLRDYCSFLKDKLTVLNASPVRGSGQTYPENVARWSVVGTQRGIEPLLETYTASAEKYGYSVTYSKGRSIFLTIGNKSPVVSVHPSKSSAAQGLWFGVSVTNLSRVHNVPFGRAEMPIDFSWQVETQSGNEWRFGYLSPDQIELTLRRISDAVSRK